MPLLAQRLQYAAIETLAQGGSDTTAHIWAVPVLQDCALYQVETANGWAIETVPFMTGCWRDIVAEPPPTIKHSLAQRSHLLIRNRGRDRFYFRPSAALRMDPVPRVTARWDAFWRVHDLDACTKSGRSELRFQSRPPRVDDATYARL
jgi:hypothetical protein